LPERGTLRKVAALLRLSGRRHGEGKRDFVFHRHVGVPCTNLAMPRGRELSNMSVPRA
jgi:hypothetical protein